MKNLIIIAALLSVTVSNAQEKIDNILTDILKNNKSIIAIIRYKPMLTAR